MNTTRRQVSAPDVPDRTDAERPDQAPRDPARQSAVSAARRQVLRAARQQTVPAVRRPALLAGALAGPGIRRIPWLTAVVVVVTAIPSCVQFAVPGLLTTLERTPTGLGGEWWRSVTALLVQDGGVLGTISNLLFLAVLGVIAEQVMSRPRWLVLYVVAGLVGEFAAYAWQPVGAGNSIAICGLAGGLAVLMIRGDRRLPAATPYAQILWAAALVATVSAVPAVLIFVATAPVLSILRARRLPATRIAGAAVLACGIALAAVQDIHGAALVAGILIGAVLVTL